MIKDIDADEFMRAQQRADIQIVDVREPAEQGLARLPGCFAAPLSSFEEQSQTLDPQKPVALLCATGYRAAKAAAILSRRGFSDIWVVAGGLGACRRLGMKLEGSGIGVWALDRQVRVCAGGLIVLGAALGATIDPWWHALAAAVGAGLVVSAVTDTCAMAWVLAKMPWNRRTT